MAKRRESKNPFEEFSNGDDFESERDSVQGAAAPAQAEPKFGVEAAVEAIPVNQVFPDVYQSRHPILPPEIRYQFWDGEIDCFEAAQVWLNLAEKHPAYQQRVQELLDMGRSFENEGQVNAITGRWAVTTDNQFVFLIETGERRYWATILSAVAEGEAEIPTINVIGYETTSRRRQVLENRHYSTPSAVSQAREIATLLLDALGISPPANRSDEIYDYFRQALDYRISQEIWDDLQTITGLTPRRMKQSLSLLKLPSHLLEWADLYELPSRQLIEIVRAPASEWETLIKTAIQEKIDENVDLPDRPSDEERERKRRRKKDRRRDPAAIALGGIRRFTNALTSAESQEHQAEIIGRLATGIVVDEQEKAGEITVFLDRLIREIEVRMKNM